MTKPTKAIVGTIIAFVGTFFTPILVAIQSNQPVTAATWATSAILAIGFAGVVFPSIYATPNKPVE